MRKILKKLRKRFKILEEDLNIFINTQLQLYHKLKKDNQGIIPISNLGLTGPEIYKARKFACRALKGRGASSGMRVIYAYFEDEGKIEMIEMYFKGDKENEDRARIRRCWGNKMREWEWRETNAVIVKKA